MIKYLKSELLLLYLDNSTNTFENSGPWHFARLTPPSSATDA